MSDLGIPASAEALRRIREDPHRLGHRAHGPQEPIQGAGHGVTGPAQKRIIVAYGFWLFLLSDIVMPGEMSGLDLALEARRQQKDLPILLMTGYAEALDKVAALEPVVELLRKPFRPQHLGLKVRQMLTQPEPTGLHTA